MQKAWHTKGIKLSCRQYAKDLVNYANGFKFSCNFYGKSYVHVYQYANGVKLSSIQYVKR